MQEPLHRGRRQLRVLGSGLIICLGMALWWPATIFGQDTYLKNGGKEIPLDGFPSFTLGYRIQLGAFSSESTASTFRDSLQPCLDQRIHLHYSDGLWRIRVGDFLDSSAAINCMHLVLAPLDYPEGIVVKDRVTGLSMAEKAEKIQGFRLQVDAFSDRDRALKLARKLDFEHPAVRAYVIEQDGLYKVQFGDFQTRAEGEVWLNKLKDTTDAKIWIVPTLIYENPPPSPVERPVSDPFLYDD